MKKMNVISLVVIFVLLISIAIPQKNVNASSPTPSIVGLPTEAIELSEFDGDNKVQLAPDFDIADIGSESLSDGYLQFEMDGGSASTEFLALDPNIAITLDNGKVLTNDGTFLYLDDAIIGKVNSALNGEGKGLKIDLAMPLENGDFELASTASDIPGWIVNTTNGNPDFPNQIYLGSLASRTQGRNYTSVTSDGSKYLVTGPNSEYTYTTDVNYGNTGVKREAIESKLTTSNSGFATINTRKDTDTNTNSSYLSLGFNGGDVQHAYGTVFAAEAISAKSFKASAGDRLTLEWSATGNADDYEVYGFLVDGNDNHTIIMYGRGARQDWTRYEVVIPADGEYKFRFVAGSHDQTGGHYLGAVLNVDNVRVLNTFVTDVVTAAMGRMVTYSTTYRPLPGNATVDEDTGVYTSPRKVNISLANSNKRVIATNSIDINLTGEIQLELLSAVVGDETPNQATLTFNLPLDEEIDASYFSGLTINGYTVTNVLSVQGKEVVVELSEPLAPGSINLKYTQGSSDGEVVSPNVATNKLKNIDINNSSVTSKVVNNVKSLVLVRATTILENRKQLKLTFNKPISTDDLLPIDGEAQSIDGLTVGGKPVKFVSLGDSDNEIIVELDEEYLAGDQLAYDKINGTLVDANNHNNVLGNITSIDLPIVSGKLNDLGLTLDGETLTLNPSFDPNNPGDESNGNGYWAVVPNDIEEIELAPTAYNPDETRIQISLNGVGIDADNGGWDQIGQLQEGINVVEVQVYDVETGIELERYTIQIVRATSKLEGLVSSIDGLNPIFESDVEDYKLSTYQSLFNITPTAIDPGATLQIVLNNDDPISVDNGIPSNDLILKLGQNIIQVIVTDSNNEIRIYQITVYRYQIIIDTTQIITVDVENDNNASENDKTKVDIYRTKGADGKTTDKVTFTPAKAQEAVDKAIAANRLLARIVVPDPKDEEDELTVTVPRTTVDILNEGKIDFEIESTHALIRLPNTSLADIDQDFYFRLLPIRETNQRSEVEARAVTAELVRQVAGDKEVSVVSRPMKIETNLSSRPVTLILPLSETEMPEDEQEKQKFLQELYIFIEHSDGDKELVKGTAVTKPDGTLGIQFSVAKFSMFTIVRGEVNSHTKYVNGYADGSFKPDNNITRAELVSMLARVGSVGNSLGEGFPDLASTHWANHSIKYAQKSGLINGYPDGEFKPDREITRDEFATIVFNYLGIAENTANIFNDVDDTHWAKGKINAVAEKNLFKGYVDGSFKPSQNVTRAEAVVVINRLLNRGPLYNIAVPTWQDVPTTHWAFHDIEEASQDHFYIERPEGGESKIQ